MAKQDAPDSETRPAPAEPAKPVKRSNPFFRRTGLAAEIIDRLADDPTFGQVKFQKCLYTFQHDLRLDEFKKNYKRMAAGPFDKKLVYLVEALLANNRRFKSEKRSARYVYRRLERAGDNRSNSPGTTWTGPPGSTGWLRSSARSTRSGPRSLPPCTPSGTTS